MGRRRHLAHLLDDPDVRFAVARVAVSVGANEKLLVLHGAPHGKTNRDGDSVVI